MCIYFREDQNNSGKKHSMTVTGGNPTYSTVTNYPEDVVLISSNPAYNVGHGDSQQPMLQDNPAYSIAKMYVVCLNFSR